VTSTEASRWSRPDLRGVLLVGRGLVGSALSLASATAITSLIGVVYWIVAARQFDAVAVGFAGAAISAMTLVATLCTLGLSTYLMGELPRSTSHARTLLSDALIVAAFAGALVAAAYALLASVLTRELSPLSENPFNVIVFAAGASMTAIGMVLDQALIGVARGGVQLVRNVVFALVKLVALAAVGLVFVDASGMTIYATWAGGAALSLLLVGAIARRRPLIVSDPRGKVRFPGPRVLRSLTRAVAGHQALNLALRLPLLLLPVLVVSWVSVEANSRFYINWMVTNVAFVLPGSLATVLYAAHSADPMALSGKLRLSLKLSSLVTIAVVLLVLLVPELLLSVFGPDYRDGATSLRLLTLAGLPLVIKNHFVTVRRAQSQVRRALPLVCGGAVLEIVMSGAGASLGGLNGLCAGWTAAIFIEGAVMYPAVRQAAQRN